MVRGKVVITRFVSRTLINQSYDCQRISFIIKREGGRKQLSLSNSHHFFFRFISRTLINQSYDCQRTQIYDFSVA